MTVAITRSGRLTSELREWQQARKTRKAGRMLAMALVLEGWSRETAAEACCLARISAAGYIATTRTD